MTTEAQEINSSEVGDATEVINPSQPQDNRKTFSFLLSRESVRTLRAETLDEAKKRLQDNISNDTKVIDVKEGSFSLTDWPRA